MDNSPPVLLTIAGSDSGGGAGIQADLKTFQAFSCFGCSAITAVTCQNTTGVAAIQELKPEIVALQIKKVLEDFPIKIIKTGMLSSTAIIRSIKKVLQEFKSKQKYYSSSFQLIVDPVMVSSNNDRLLEESAITELISFMSMADIITPNLPEAELILGYTSNTLDTIDKMKTATLALHNKFDTTVLLKGGHLANTKQKSSR